MEQTLEHGAEYRAELDLPWYATKSMANAELTKAGFAHVVIYEADGKTLAQGTWTGETQLVDVPAAIKRVWRV